MALTVTVLGCSGSYAAPGNPCTGYLVRSDTTAVLLDCGPGTLGPLQEVIHLAELDSIVITHCHPDHWLELPMIRNVFIWFVPRSNVAVYGTAETRAMDQAITAMHNDRKDPLDWNVIGPASQFGIGDQQWSFALTDHPVETLATRVDSGGRSFAFSADTGPGWDFRSLGEGIDLALCEASHGRCHEGKGSPHLSARQAAQAAAIAGIERLVLTHLPPGCDRASQLAEASEAFAGEVDVARPGLALTV